MAITRRSLAALGASVLAASRQGLAADWPAERPIMVVVPFPPGGGVDGMARVILPFVRKHLPGATFVVENRPGAGSQLGLEAVFAAKPDGYTLCAVSSPVLMTMPYERRVRYRVADFTYIAQVVDDPGALWVRKASPISDLGDLLDRAGKNPGGLGFGTTGIGSDDHLLQLEIEQAKPGVSFNHVPFNGQAPLQTALLGGHIDVGCFNISEGIAGHRDGILRCLGQAAAERDPSLPDVPTFSELGVKVVAGAQRGILAPPGLPEPIAAKLTEAFAAAIADPGFAEDAKRLQLPVHGLMGAEFRRSVLGLDARLNEMWARKPWRDQ
jgi:tripartite-type tricarboxylate transporter receptor subunit TctC